MCSISWSTFLLYSCLVVLQFLSRSSVILMLWSKSCSCSCSCKQLGRENKYVQTSSHNWSMNCLFVHERFYFSRFWLCFALVYKSNQRRSVWCSFKTVQITAVIKHASLTQTPQKYNLFIHESFPSPCFWCVLHWCTEVFRDKQRWSVWCSFKTVQIPTVIKHTSLTQTPPRARMEKAIETIRDNQEESNETIVYSKM